MSLDTEIPELLFTEMKGFIESITDFDRKFLSIMPNGFFISEWMSS